MKDSVKMRIRGYIYLALVLAIGSGLSSLYYETASQVEQRTRISMRINKIVPSGKMIDLARREHDSQAVFNDVSNLIKQSEKINIEAVASWGDIRDKSPIKYLLLTTTSYIGAFTAPESIASGISFLPGIIEVLLFLTLACYFFWRAGVKPVEEKA